MTSTDTKHGPARPNVDRRDRSDYFFGTTNRYWHDALRKIFSRIDEAGISYCLLHGYAGYDGVESGDIDCIVGVGDLPVRFGQALSQAAATENYHLINSYYRSQQAHLFVLAKETEAGFDFVWLDVAFANFEGHWKYIDGPEMLAARRQVNGFWATSPAIEFAAYISTKITKQKLDPAHASRLTSLYNLAPADCERELKRFFTQDSVRLIAAAAQQDDWAAISENIAALKREVLSIGRKRALRRPSSALAYLFGEMVRLPMRLTRQTGLHLLIRGPEDTASTVASEAARSLAPAFRRVELRRGHDRPRGLLKRAVSSLRTRWLLSKTNLVISVQAAGSQGSDAKRSAHLSFELDNPGSIDPDRESVSLDSTVRRISAAAIDLMEKRNRRWLRWRP